MWGIELKTLPVALLCPLLTHIAQLVDHDWTDNGKQCTQFQILDGQGIFLADCRSCHVEKKVILPNNLQWFPYTWLYFSGVHHARVHEEEIWRSTSQSILGMSRVNPVNFDQNIRKYKPLLEICCQICWTSLTLTVIIKQSHAANIPW